MLKYQRTEYSPGLFSVSRPGALMLFSVYVTRGLAIVGLLKSPLRRGIGEVVFRLFWMGTGGRTLLRVAGRGLRGAAKSGEFRTTAPAPVATISATATSETGLEARVTSLETWRAAMERRN